MFVPAIRPDQNIGATSAQQCTLLGEGERCPARSASKAPFAGLPRVGRTGDHDQICHTISITDARPAANSPVEDPSAKAVTAMLREARSQRRADQLNATAAAVGDPTTQELTTQACTSMQQLVHQLMLLERQAQRGEQSAGRHR